MLVLLHLWFDVFSATVAGLRALSILSVRGRDTDSRENLGPFPAAPPAIREG